MTLLNVGTVTNPPGGRDGGGGGGERKLNSEARALSVPVGPIPANSAAAPIIRAPKNLPMASMWSANLQYVIKLHPNYAQYQDCLIKTRTPIAQFDDLPGLIEEPVPGVAAGVEDLGVGGEGAV